jgi:hypothetical protein
MRIVTGYREERGVRDGGTRKTLRNKTSASNEEDVDKVHIILALPEKFELFVP